jgi:hypothetical protein
MRPIKRALVLVILAIVALTPSANAAAQRPMSASFTVGVVPVEQRCGPNALTIGFEGIGIATHLGQLTGGGTNCTEFTLATESVAIWDGILNLVAADGSTLTATYTGVQSAPVAGVATTTTTNTVVSGTGRFEDAAGSWTGSGELDFTTGIFHGRFSGWISY